MDQTSGLQGELAEIRKMASSQLYNTMYQRLLTVTVGALLLISGLFIVVGVAMQVNIYQDDFLASLMLSLSTQLVSSTVVFVLLSLAAKPVQSAAERENGIRHATRVVLITGIVLIILAGAIRLIFTIYAFPGWFLSFILSPILLNLGTGFLGAFIIFMALEKLVKLFEAQNEINTTMMNRIDQISEKLQNGKLAG